MKIFNQHISPYRIAFILMLSSIIGLTYNLMTDNGISLRYQEISLQAITGNNKTEPHYENIKAIGLIEAYAMFEDGATFLDARDMWEYGERHIAGALNLPFIEFEPRHELLSKLEHNEKLVIYCGDTECGLSTKLAIELSKLGYENLYVFGQGWNSWVNAGYPVEGEIEQ